VGTGEWWRSSASVSSGGLYSTTSVTVIDVLSPRSGSQRIESPDTQGGSVWSGGYGLTRWVRNGESRPNRGRKSAGGWVLSVSWVRSWAKLIGVEATPAAERTSST